MRANTLAVRRARQRARERGYCGSCCARPARPGLRTCERCGEAGIARREKTIERRESEGCCRDCGATPLETLLRCAACAEKQREDGRARRRRRRWGPVIWLLAVAQRFTIDDVVATLAGWSDDDEREAEAALGGARRGDPSAET